MHYKQLAPVLSVRYSCIVITVSTYTVLYALTCKEVLSITQIHTLHALIHMFKCMHMHRTLAHAHIEKDVAEQREKLPRRGEGGVCHRAIVERQGGCLAEDMFHGRNEQCASRSLVGDVMMKGECRI